MKRTESFTSVVSPQIPQCYPAPIKNNNNNNTFTQNDNNFVNQSQVRRHVPLPSGHNNIPSISPGPPIPQRNMSSSVFSLNHAGYPQQHAGYQPQNTWGMNPMGQVGFK